MSKLPALLALAALLVASPGARADYFTDLAAQVLDHGGAAGAAALAVVEVAGTTTRNVAGVVGASGGSIGEAAVGYLGAVLGTQGDGALLAGAGQGRTARDCGKTFVALEQHRKGVEPTVVLVLGPGASAPTECPAHGATFRAAQVQGDAERGWVATAASAQGWERLTVGPRGDGTAIALAYEAFQGGVRVRSFDGVVVSLA
jgi:hypothetical protein